jgi:NAD(P)-dependent dehydrogenase (short-subunit alcohol dehydrogenase family)
MRRDGAKMSLYRADPEHGVAWITGGGTGIGRALALELAGKGFVVAVTGLPQDPVDAVIGKAAGLAGRILSFPCDVTDEGGMARAVAAIEDRAGPIVLAVFNAGVLLPVRGEDLDLRSFRASYEVNLFGVLNGLVPAVRRMHARNRGHVVIVGSITEAFGLPTIAAYGATKAALNNMAQSLRYDFAKMNVRIQVINPGFVDTALTAGTEFRLPALMPVERAAARMAKAIASGGFETSFPRRLAWIVKLLRAMPPGVAFALVNAASRWKGRPLGIRRRDRHEA